MLQVMNAGHTELPHSVSGNDNNILMNCWGKPSPLIKELEKTVNFAERKCGDLMQQLSYYKEYYEKWSQSGNSTSHKKKPKRCFQHISDFGSSSENEFERVNQYFYQRIKNKISEMNNEISEVNRKLRNKNEFCSSVRMNEPKTVEVKSIEQVENKTCKSEPSVCLLKTEDQPSVDTGQKSECQINEKQLNKSVFTKRKRDVNLSKKKYSSLQRFKLRSKSLPQGVRRKFGFGGFFEVFDPETKNIENEKRSKSKTSLKSNKSGKSRKSESKSKTRLVESQTRFSDKSLNNEARTSKSLHCSRSNTKMDFKVNSNGAMVSNDLKKNLINESVSKLSQAKHQNLMKPENNTCQAVVVSNREPESFPEINIKQNISHIVAKPNSLIPFLRRPIPFIPCSSTSKTFNLGLNVQQVLSLIKHKRHTSSLQALMKTGIQVAPSLPEKSEQTINTLFFTQTTTRHSTAVCPARDGSEDCFSIMTGTIESPSKCSIVREIQTAKTKSEDETKIKKWDMEFQPKMGGNGKFKFGRPEDVWVVEQPDGNPNEFRKIQNRCTCFPSKHCVDYHKLLRQYTGWRLPVTKSDKFGSEVNSEYNPVVTCSNSNLYAFPSKIDTEANDGKLELNKVYNDLLNLNRKYSVLQDRISQNNLDDYEANAELDAMESELAVREVEFKDILNFYNQLMVLKEKLKSLRSKGGQPSNTANIKPKKDPLRPTPSMALTKVLRKIQGLQDKIKLINTP